MANRQNVKSKPAARSRPGLSIVKSRDESPPQHDSSISFSKKLRFTATVACSNSAFTQVQLMDLLGMVTSAGVAYRTVSAARVRKLSVWAVPFSAASTSQSNVTVGIEFSNLGVAGSFGSPPKRYSDTSQNPAKYAYVSASPDPDSLSGKWFNDDGTSPVFLLTCPLNAIIDLTMDFVLRNGETAVATRALLGGATVGNLGILTMTSASTAAGVLTSADYLAIV